jgi:hypothetical protein
MKNILKTTLVLFSIFALTSANAGTLTVTGNAKASYSIVSSDGTAGKSEARNGIGISNEFTLGASGETDGGIAWKYAIDMDGTGATAADDQQLVLTLPTMGAIGIYISEGGIDVDNSWDKSVYARPSDTSYNELKRDAFSIGDLNNVQYHTPAGLLPFGIAAKIAYAPNNDGTINDVNATGAANINGTDSTSIAEAQTLTTGFQGASTVSASSMTAYQVTAAPIEGLVVGASYETFSGTNASLAQKPESGSWYATYAAGPVSVGYGKTYVAYELTTVTAGTTELESSENTNYSVAFAVNDDLSISYTKEKSKLVAPTSSTTTSELDAAGIQAAYTMGGMTLSVAQNTFNNAAYTNNKDVTNTVFGLALAF